MNHFLPIAALALGLAACSSGSATPAPKAPSTEPALTVRAETLATAIPVNGIVTARRRAEIATRMMARIAEVPVDIGTRVHRGEPLIRLGGEDVAAGLAKAGAAVDAAQAARDEAARQAARMDTLLAADAVSQVQRDQARLGLAQADAQLTLAQATRREAETAARYATIVAPFDGAVVTRTVDAGDLATPGAPLLTLESVGPRDAVLDVPVDLALRLRTGTVVRVLSDDGRAADARVRAVAAGADGRTRTVEVRAVLPADWPTGLSVTGLIPAGAHLGIAIPASAVVRRGQLTGVRVETAEGASLRWVRLGRTLDSDRVEILTGLEAGDRILR